MTIVERLTEGGVSKLELKGLLRRAPAEELEALTHNNFFYEESIMAGNELEIRAERVDTERLDGIVARIKSGEISLAEAVAGETEGKFIEPLMYAARTEGLTELAQHFLTVVKLAAFIIDRRSNPPPAAGEE